jgi:ABC-type lipoprotein release transport system permease subunit
MRRQAIVRLVALNVRHDRRSAVSSIFGVAIGVASLVFFVSLGLGVAHVVREKVFPVDARLVEVVPSALALGLFDGRLDQAAVDRLAALPGVNRAYRKMNVRVPAVSLYDGDFFGRRLRMGVEILAVGVEADYVRRDVELGTFTDAGAGQPLPAIVSTRLLEVYNKSFAPARGLPQLGRTLLVGFTFPVEFNRSFVTATPEGPRTAGVVQVVGVSDRGLLGGITIPLETAMRLNRASGADAATYTGVALEAASPDDVPALVAAVKAMGLGIDDAERRMSENVGAAVAITTSAMALLSLLICLLAAFNIAHALSAAVRSREKELGVFRAVGAARRDVFGLVIAEAAFLGALGGLVGSVLALGGSVALDVIAAKALPEFLFKPDSFFVLPWWLVCGGVALGILAAVSGAWFPARRASRVDPARVLAGQGG